MYRQAVLKEAFAKFHAFTSLKQASERIFDGPFISSDINVDMIKSSGYTVWLLIV